MLTAKPSATALAAAKPPRITVNILSPGSVPGEREVDEVLLSIGSETLSDPSPLGDIILRLPCDFIGQANAGLFSSSAEAVHQVERRSRTLRAQSVDTLVDPVLITEEWFEIFVGGYRVGIVIRTVLIVEGGFHHKATMPPPRLPVPWGEVLRRSMMTHDDPGLFLLPEFVGTTPHRPL